MRVRTPIVLLTLLAAAGGDVPARAQLLPPGSPDVVSAPLAVDSQAGYEVLTRGPVHEAFAEIAAASPEPGMVIPRQPPQPIEEQPPETRPEGDNVVWLPGYWHWDDDRQDFLWVSGVWRAVPPGREWTPGYWREGEGGYQWVAGYWADRSAASAEVQYLPPPPETLEAGPTSPAPGENYVWSPGCWMWNSARYVWQPGYWIVVQPNWIWIPHYYVWTPYGCVLAGGYQDFVVQRRGLLFAPIYFTSPIYAQPAFAYRPSYCIGFDVLTAYLFARPRACHYYFGDYFAPRYAGIGYRPWFQSSWGRSNYDPLFAYYRQVNRRQDRDWDRRLAGRFNYFRDHETARPPRTLQAQQAALASAGRGGAVAVPGGALQIAQSAERFRQSARDRYGVQLGQASAKQLEQATERRDAWKNLQTSRRRAETADGGATSKAPAAGGLHDPRRARWNVENPIARDVPNMPVPEAPRRSRPTTNPGLAQPSGANSPGNATSRSPRDRVRPDLGNRGGGQVGRDRGAFGPSPRDNAITNPSGTTDLGSRQTLRPTPRPGADSGESLPGVGRTRRPPSEGSRGRPAFEGTLPGQRPQGGESPREPNLSTPERSPRTSPDQSLLRGPSGLENNRGPRDNVFRAPHTTPNLTQPTLPQSSASGFGRSNRQRSPASSGGGEPSNFGRQTLQRPFAPPSSSSPSSAAPTIQRSTPIPRQLPGGGGAGPGGAQFRRPTADGGAVAAPSGGGSGPQINRGAAGRGRGRAERDD